MGTHKRIAAGAVMGLGMVLLLAHAEPAKPATAGAGDAAESASSFDNLEIVDAGLNKKIEVQRVGSGQGPNGLLTVFAGLKNKTARKVLLEVETIYRDKSGNALNTGSWIRVSIDPHGESDYRSTAISESAVDFLIRVRHAVTPSH